MRPVAKAIKIKINKRIESVIRKVRALTVFSDCSWVYT
jgi:hypothetical protein